jgi:hypothetical protein
MKNLLKQMETIIVVFLQSFIVRKPLSRRTSARAIFCAAKSDDDFSFCADHKSRVPFEVCACGTFNKHLFF